MSSDDDDFSFPRWKLIAVALFLPAFFFAKAYFASNLLEELAFWSVFGAFLLVIHMIDRETK